MGNIHFFTKNFEFCCLPDPNELSKYDKQNNNEKSGIIGPSIMNNTQRDRTSSIITDLESIPESMVSSPGGDSSSGSPIVTFETINTINAMIKNQSADEYDWSVLPPPVDFTPHSSDVNPNNKDDMKNIKIASPKDNKLLNKQDYCTNINNNKSYIINHNNQNNYNNQYNPYYKQPLQQTGYVLNGKLPALLDAESVSVSETIK
eukprot:CAMPEP_0114665344 /NCGR_PEP_ID=MMETSP0191-20121206/30571_1 /TAXON_ID=126664 /ORGANISM="Sorites sp." /LENGTH=203 /DNA_ID=CAMNT_0001910107 /DNA_START=23 /DNA_END=634 /DNA_ORIENTATION=-